MPRSRSPANVPELAARLTAAADRRASVPGALWRSSFARRRIGLRRRSDRNPVMTDWYQPHWLAVAVAILVLCGYAVLIGYELALLRTIAGY